MRSTLGLLLLFGAVIGISATTKTCTLYELPEDGECEITINWKVRSDKDALATCLEYFPTTFVKGKMVGGKAKCTVTAAYQCAHHRTNDVKTNKPGVFLMYDKCYYFPKDANDNYLKGTIDDYDRTKTNGKKICGDGKLSVFYSHTHAKFLGMKAHKLEIDKLWIGITADGREIEKPKRMIHPKMWKLIEGDYWDGEEKLVKVAKDAQFPAKANYFFMRTRTDHVMNRLQGSFERTTGAMKATFACEFDAMLNSQQKWYCDKLPMMGIDAVYDEEEKDSTKTRCLYLTASKYTFNGKYEDMNNIKGCKERPSQLHSVGMDDGTATKNIYGKFKNKGKLRLAGFREDTSKADPLYGKYIVQGKGKTTKYKKWEREQLLMKWRSFHYSGKIQYSVDSQIPWDADHPLNEGSDFPSESTTLGLKNGVKIDMPPEVRAHAVCSIRFFQECDNRKPCGETQECTNKDSFQTDTNSFNTASPKNKEGFFTCACAGPIQKGTTNTNLLHIEDKDNKTCTWKPNNNDKCAWLDFGDGEQTYFLNKGRGDLRVHDKLQQIVVKHGCKATIMAAAVGYVWNADLLRDAPFGTHNVPNTVKGSLSGEYEGMGASAAHCTCT